MIDCRTYEISNIRPLAGEVLVEILEPTVTAGGIHIPETFPRYLEDLERVKALDPPQAQEAIIRKIGPANGAPPDFVLGDRVIVDRRSGRTVNQPPRCLKLVRQWDVLAKFV